MTSSAPHFALLKHRLIAIVYEAILLFGVFFGAGLVFDVLSQNINQAELRHWRQLYLFIVVGFYFTYFWRHSGQTLPMQTWHIKVVSALDQQPISFKQACLRYCIAWMWVLPALAFNYWFDIQHWAGVAVFLVSMALWALLAKLDKNGQFLHDRLAGTCLISIRQKVEN